MSYLATQARVHGWLVYEKIIVGGKIMRSGRDTAPFCLVLILNCFLICLCSWPGPPPNYKAMDFEPNKKMEYLSRIIHLFSPVFPLKLLGQLT